MLKITLAGLVIQGTLTREQAKYVLDKLGNKILHDNFDEVLDVILKTIDESKEK